MPVAADASREVSGSPRFAAPRRLLAALSDERLANRLGQGDEVAFELIYDRHHGGLLGFCRHMLRSHHEAEDAVQQAFIAAYRAITEKGDRPTRVKPWLYAIGRNCCLAIIRGRREASPPLTEDAGASASGPPEEAEQRADLHALVEDLRRLPEAQRSALVLAELGGLAHREVAEVLGCRPAKVRALVFQARSALLEQREARGASCQEVREKIASDAGGRLRGLTRRHVRSCAGCAGFYDDVRSQRRMLALVLPVAPSFGMKRSVLAATTGAGGGSGGAGGGAGAAAGAALETASAGGTATGGATVAGTAAGGGAAAATAGGGVAGAAGGGAAAGAAASGGAFAGGGVLAAITAHSGLTKATAVALAAGSVAAGAQVAETTDRARPADERRSEDRAPARAEGRQSSLAMHADKAPRPEQAGRSRGGSERRDRPSAGDRSQGTGRERAGSPPGAAGHDSSSGSPPAHADGGGGSRAGTREGDGSQPRGSSGQSDGGSERADRPQRSASGRSDTSGHSGKELRASAGRAAPSGQKPVRAQDASGAVRSTTDAASRKVQELKNRP